MAGYIIYSLDWSKFQKLIEQPTATQLSSLAEALADERRGLDGEFDDDDPILAWPSEVKGLKPIVAQRLALPDWYGDLSDAGRNLWEMAFYVSCMRSEELDVGFRVDNDGVYWDVITLISKLQGQKPETPGETAMSRFGTVPFRYHPPAKPGKRAWDDGWTPMHSMHPPEEVQRMVTELRSVAANIQASPDPDIRQQFGEDLLPSLEHVAQDGRMLFIQVDT